MKKILSLTLALLMLLSLAACSSSLAEEEAASTAEAKETATAEKKDDGEIVYPEGFSVGFGRADITPEPPVEIGTDQFATKVIDPLYASCVALCDGEEVALIVHLDMKSIPYSFYEAIASRFEKKFGIDGEKIILNATHSHNSPLSVMGSDDASIRWRSEVYPAMDKMAEEALRDLSAAKVYAGTAQTEDFAFVRRYRMADGSYRSVQTANPCTEYAAHESEADDELRTLHFEREGKKDIVMVNWQAHAAHGRTASADFISSDFIYELRTGVEKEMDVHFAYYNGASGNLNLTDRLGKQKFENYHEVGTALVDVVKESVKNETEINSGKIKSAAGVQTLQVIQETPERIAAAEAYFAAPASMKKDVLAQYGLASSYEATAINTRKNRGESVDIHLFAVACGDFAFATAPFEQFDSDGKAIRDGSPYEMTFSCAYANGHYGYLPSSFAFPNGEYEVYTTSYAQGSSDLIVAEAIRLLNETKK